MDHLFLAEVLTYFAQRAKENAQIHGVSVYAITASPQFTVELRYQQADGTRTVAAQTLSSKQFMAAETAVRTLILDGIERLLMERIDLLLEVSQEYT